MDKKWKETPQWNGLSTERSNCYRDAVFYFFDAWFSTFETLDSRWKALVSFFANLNVLESETWHFFFVKNSSLYVETKDKIIRTRSQLLQYQFDFSMLKLWKKWNFEVNLLVMIFYWEILLGVIQKPRGQDWVGRCLFNWLCLST